MSKVYVFNTGATAVYVNVNNAPPPKILTVPGADKSTWVAGTLDAASLPDFTGSKSGGPGEFFIGNNSVGITLATDNTQSGTVNILIPDGVSPTDTLQLYIFWESASNISWMLLKSGKPIGGSLKLPT